MAADPRKAAEALGIQDVKALTVAMKTMEKDPKKGQALLDKLCKTEKIKGYEKLVEKLRKAGLMPPAAVPMKK